MHLAGSLRLGRIEKKERCFLLPPCSEVARAVAPCIGVVLVGANGGRGGASASFVYSYGVVLPCSLALCPRTPDLDAGPCTCCCGATMGSPARCTAMPFGPLGSIQPSFCSHSPSVVFMDVRKEGKLILRAPARGRGSNSASLTYRLGLANLPRNKSRQCSGVCQGGLLCL